jgi:hypothetical protein
MMGSGIEPAGPPAGSYGVTDLADLEDAVARALEAQDFETAAALRAGADLRRQELAPMDSFFHARRVTPEGWTRPAQADQA